MLRADEMKAASFVARRRLTDVDVLQAGSPGSATGHLHGRKWKWPCPGTLGAGTSPDYANYLAVNYWHRGYSISWRSLELILSLFPLTPSPRLKQCNTLASNGVFDIRNYVQLPQH